MAVILKWRNLKNGTKSAFLEINHSGKRTYEFLKIHLHKSDSSTDKKEKKSLAIEIRTKRELETISDSYKFFTPSHKKKVNFIKYYENYVLSYSKKDIRKVRYSFEKFKIFYGKDVLEFRDVDEIICKDFQEYLKEKSGLNGETPYDYWKRFKGVLKQAVIDGIIPSSPAANIEFKGYTNLSNQLRKEILTKDELQTLAATRCTNSEVKRAFLLACYTGLGLAEIKKLTWSRIANNKIKIYREKNGKQVINDLNPTALKLLGDYGNPNECIFLLPSDVAVNKGLKSWVKRAGLQKNISFYCGRHTFATMLLFNGASLKTVADCLGHVNTKHTIKYLYYTDELKGNAINNLPNIDI